VKYSRQRAAIKSELAKHKDHPTADELYIQLRSCNPNISLGTVYRNLNQLAEAEQILRIAQEGGPVRFDGNPIQHYHFVCNTCERMVDIDMPMHNELDEIVAQEIGAQVKGHSVLFYGVCKDCLNQS